MLDKSNQYINVENLKTLVSALNDKNHMRDIVIEENINYVSSQIKEEESRAITSEIAIQANLNDEASRLNKLIEDSKNTLQKNIDTETQNRLNDTNLLTNSLINLDKDLQLYTNNTVNQAKINLRSEFQVADESIRKDLRLESSSRENKDALLDLDIKNINESIATIKSEYNSLKNRVTSNESLSKNNNNILNQHNDSINNINNNLNRKVSLNSPNQTITGNLNITGNLKVSGTTITKDTETSLVKDNFIIINSDGETLSSQLSGISIRTDAENAYGIAYDIVNDSVSLGSGKISNGSFSFNPNESKPILTRDVSSNIKNGSMLIWDADRNIAVDGGIIDVEEIKKEFVPLSVHYALEDRVESNASKIFNLDLNISSHKANKNNPHNVTWDQINSNALNTNINPYRDNDIPSIGTSTRVARADHIHPTDTSRAPVNHVSATNIYGQGSTDKFGHVKVDNIISTSSINPVQNNVITSYINNEINRAIEQETLLKSNLDNEIDRAQEAEQKLDAIIKDLNYQLNGIGAGNTLSYIRQVEGKINVRTQAININIEQVKNLSTELSNIRSEFALQDKSLAEQFDAADEGLRASIDDNQERVIKLESTVQNATSINDSIEVIIDKINNGEYSQDQNFILAFESIEDSMGNFVRYAPTFISTMDDGILD